MKKYNENYITLLEAVSILRGRKKFVATFLKRTDGSERTIVGRVKRKRGDGKGKYNFAEHNLFSVYDTEKKEYRTIPLEGLLTVNGKKITWAKPFEI